jgi:hypothetical protein
MRKVSIVDTEISLTDAAKLISKTPRWVTELVKAGRIKHPKGGLYRPVEVVRGYVASILESKKQTNKSASLAQVQTARAAEIELRTARQERRIIKTDEAIAFVDEVLGVLKADFDGAAASITRDPGLRNQIEVKINDILAHAAARYEQKASALREGGDATEADTGDAAGHGRRSTAAIRQARASPGSVMST